MMITFEAGERTLHDGLIHLVEGWLIAARHDGKYLTMGVSSFFFFFFSVVIALGHKKTA